MKETKPIVQLSLIKTCGNWSTKTSKMWAP